MGAIPLAILLLLLVCWWLVRKWPAMRRAGTRSEVISPGTPAQHIRAIAPKAPASETDQNPERKEERGQVVTLSLSPLSQLHTDPRPGSAVTTSGKTRIDFNEIEIENAHSSMLDAGAVQDSGQPSGPRPTANRGHSRLSRAPSPERQGVACSSDNKIGYLEKQIHENNRDITMLSEKLAKSIEANQANKRQFEHALRSEQDRVLFFESRVQADIEKLNQVEAGLRRRGSSLDQLSELIERNDLLEEQALRDRHEIARLNELLALAKGYQTGSNKRNQELDTLLRQASRISQLESSLRKQNLAGSPPISAISGSKSGHIPKSGKTVREA